ncbi:MAG: GNAT family N-acetyltransferase [Flavobacteriaceae bacterium]
MKIFAETDRLILREIEETDIEGMFALDSDPEVHIFLGNNPVKSRDESKMIIDEIRNQYRDFGIGRWAVIDKQNGEFVGWSGLKFERTVRVEFDYYDLGYRLRKAYWGKGIATETSRLALAYGFGEMKLEEICGAAAPANTASNNVLQKAGLRFIQNFEYDGETQNWYAIKRSEWEQAQKMTD